MSVDAKPTIDLLDPASFDGGQPHDTFAWLRANEPVFRHPKPDGGHFWAITRHADVRAIGRDHRTFSNAAGGIHINDMPADALAVVNQMMLYQDPPKHHRYRRLVRDPFQPDGASAMNARISQLAHEIVDKVAGRGECDLVEDIAGELPSYVIADMLGIPLDDGRRLYTLTEKMHSANVPPEEGGAAVFEMLMYAAEVRNRKLAEPADDISSALVHATVDGEELSADEFNWFFLLLINAGGDTTRNAVGGGMLALFEHPDERRRLQADLDGLAATATDEILRWCSPVIYMRRTALKDTEVGGVPIAEGDALALYYGAANRDSDVFTEADRFDVGRRPNDHIAFGGGVHFCLGVHIARVEIEAMLRELLTRLPDIEPAGDAEWLESNFISGPKRLPVRWPVRYSPHRTQP
jgi:cytochrome P450